MLDLPTPVQEMSEEVSEYTDISENMLSLVFLSMPLLFSTSYLCSTLLLCRENVKCRL